MLGWLLRLLRGEEGFGRISTGAAMVVALGGGLGAYYVATQGGAPADGTANVWMDVGGGTCTRSSTPILYADAASPDHICGTVANSCSAANAGDTVRVNAGSYGDQRSSCKETDWVTYYLDASATMDRAGPTDNGAYYLKMIGGTITHPAVCVANDVFPSHIWYEANHAHFDEVTCYGQRMLYIGGDDTTIIGPGDIGPNDNGQCPSGTDQTHDNYIDSVNGVLIKNMDVHDFDTFCGPTPHSETFRFQGTSSNVTFEGNRFWNNSDLTSTFFFSGGSTSNIVWRNNFFSSTRGAYSIIFETQGPTVTGCGWTIEYNSFDDINGSSGTGNIFLINGGETNCSGSNVIFRGNIGPARSADCFGTWTYNVYQNPSDISCHGSTNIRVNGTAGEVGNLGFVDPGAIPIDLHLTGSSAGRNAGDPNNFPADDIDHDSRPLDAGDNENVDAGADERS